ncbi:hypothetical protein LCGC14_0651230 [marine sediment metagenome]|uniref:Uncharacterized protein n=1 Tax=marine sediment metagenome TaxID=412755 RepID=A0A0F9R1J3_9ZZZZ
MQLIFIIFLIAVFFLSIIISHNKNSKALGGIAIIIAIIIGAISLFDGIDLKIGTNSTLNDDNRSITNVDIYEPVDPNFSRAIGLMFFIVVFYLAWILSTKENE